MPDVDALLQFAAGVPFGCAALVALVTVARVPAAGRSAPAELAAGVALSLEFLLAAGLVRLSALRDLQALAAVAAIVLLRKLMARGIALAGEVLDPSQLTRRGEVPGRHGV